jgi:hypothetical protein
MTLGKLHVMRVHDDPLVRGPARCWLRRLGLVDGDVHEFV